MNLKIKIIEENQETKASTQIIDIKVENQLFVQMAIAMMETHVSLSLAN